MPRARLLSLKTAVPPYILDQSDARVRAALIFQERKDIARLLPIFENTGIQRRHFCVPADWYSEEHGWTERTNLYLENAVALLEEVSRSSIAAAGLKANNIDVIVTVSTTGIATPSLDALLVERLNLRRDIKRLPIFGLGCAGGVIGLARAESFARADPGCHVLFLVVELCGPTFRRNDISTSNIVGAALFADGAAGAVIGCDGAGPVIGATGEYTWPSSLNIMGWEVAEDGLKARFAQSIPSLVAEDFRKIALDFLKRNDLSLAGITSFACHPGGAKVLDALEDALGLSRGALVDSRTVLRDFGNMSAATALFVLDRIRARGALGRCMMSSLGPGFSAGFVMLEEQ